VQQQQQADLHCKAIHWEAFKTNYISLIYASISKSQLRRTT